MCKNGEKCNYKHREEGKMNIDKKKNKKEEICWWYKNGKCKFQERCRKRHVDCRWNTQCSNAKCEFRHSRNKNKFDKNREKNHEQKETQQQMMKQIHFLGETVKSLMEHHQFQKQQQNHQNYYQLQQGHMTERQTPQHQNNKLTYPVEQTENHQPYSNQTNVNVNQRNNQIQY